MVNLLRQLRSNERDIFIAAGAIVLSLGIVLSSFFIVSEAQALRISMKRIIFEGPKRSDIISIINNTAQEQTYRLGLKHYRMDAERSLVKLEGPDDPAGADIRWADEMIRYAPRRVTVPPGGSQQIRLLLRRPRDLADGEYRSHLWIITETDAEAFEANKPANAGAQSFRLAMTPASTLPILVRSGQMNIKSSITNAKVSDVGGGKHKVSFTVNREGNRSLYGDLRVICTGSGEYVASNKRGIAVYTELTKREFSYEYDVPADQAAACRSVRIEYLADKDDAQYNGALMAQANASM